MKIDIRPLDKVYEECLSGGLIRNKSQVDAERVKSLIDSVERGLERLKAAGESYEKETRDYSFYLTDRYELLHMLVDAFLYLEKKKGSNHQACFAYLCQAHPELEFDWNALETMRILRNGVSYEGLKVKPEQWGKVKIQFKIYVDSLLKIVKGKLKKLS